MAVQRPCRYSRLIEVMEMVTWFGLFLLWGLGTWKWDDVRLYLIGLGLTAAVIGPVAIASKWLPVPREGARPSLARIRGALKGLIGGAFCGATAWAATGRGFGLPLRISALVIVLPALGGSIAGAVKEDQWMAGMFVGQVRSVISISFARG